MSLNVPVYGGGYSTDQGTLIERLKQAQINAAMATQARVTNVAGTTQGIDNSAVYSAEKEAYDKAMYDGNTCTDGKDDGKIGFFASIGNAIEGVGKAIVNGVKGMFTDAEGNFSLGKTLLSVGMVAASFIPVVGPFIGGAMACVGVASGVMGVVNAATAAANATTDAEAKQAWENIGGGVFTAAASAVALKGSASMMKHQLNGGSAMVSAIKSGAGKQAIKAGLKQDFTNNVTAVWNGARDLGRKARQKAGEYWKEPGKLWDDAVVNPCRNLKNKVTNAYHNYKNGFITKELRTVDIPEGMSTAKGKTVTKIDSGSTYTEGGKTYIYNDKGQLTKITIKGHNGEIYTYGTNGKLQTVQSKTLSGSTKTDTYSTFGRNKTTTYKYDDGRTGTIQRSKFSRNNETTWTKTKTVNNQQITETTTIKTDGTKVVTQKSLDGKTLSTTTTRLDGTRIVKNANGTTKTYNVGDTQFGYTKNHWYNRKKYTINGNPTTTASQKWLSRGTNAYNWMMDQKALGIAGPRFGQLTNINPNSVMYNNPGVQQAILTGYISNRTGNGF